MLPHVLTGPEVVLPLSQAQWLVEQPEHVLSQTEVNRQFLEADHTFLHANIVREPVHPEVIRRELTHKLGSFAEGIVDELERCLDETWGTDSDTWREVRVYDTMLDLMSRLSTRVFVGEPLCSNQEFLKSARSFDRNVVLSAAALNLLPGFLKPYVLPASFYRSTSVIPGPPFLFFRPFFISPVPSSSSPAQQPRRHHPVPPQCRLPLCRSSFPFPLAYPIPRHIPL